MNARKFFISSLSLGTLAFASVLSATPSQANPAPNPTPIVNVSTSYTVAPTATIAFQNNSACNIQVLLTDTQEVRYVAPGQTVQFQNAHVGTTPTFIVSNPSNGQVMQTLNLQPIASTSFVSFQF